VEQNITDVTVSPTTRSRDTCGAVAASRAAGAVGCGGFLMLADQRGADTFPMRLICYATLTAAIAWLVLSGIHGASEKRENDRVLLEMDSLFVHLDELRGGAAVTMYSALPSPGASVLAALHLPEDTRYIAFGSYPETDGYDPGGELGEPFARIAYLSTDSLGLHSWALEGDVMFGAVNSRGGKLFPPVETLVIEGGGKTELLFTMAFNPISGEYWVLVECVDSP